MDQIPVELIQKIFIYLDLKSLPNAALACRVFLNAFIGAEEVITTKVLLRQIDYDVLPEAILVYKSWSLGTPSFPKGIEFAKNLQHRQPAPTQWRLANALPLAYFHGMVSYFASQAASEALEEEPRLSRKSASPTREEICRFERAIYRFQLYCNVVGPLRRLEETKLQDVFFKHFAAWENEQLACIHEFFVRVVAHPFNYMVQYDITWGYLRVPLIDTGQSEYAQGILCEGITKMYWLSKAENYSNCRFVLSRRADRNGVPFRVAGFLSPGLEIGANPSVLTEALSEMSQEDKARVSAKPFYVDPDPGPASMWEWVYRDAVPGRLVANPSMICERRWGFPFWDSSRLLTAGLLEDPEIPGPWAPVDPSLVQYRTQECIDRLEQSRKERTDIRVLGGTGCYLWHI
ncbi:hypothetical protein GGR51DRAFT_378710 [Nemania sp. FL0031]|nr:hypothetical protein GGR51DRAFT_378710 [Nemania sp. FL0031]